VKREKNPGRTAVSSETSHTARGVKLWSTGRRGSGHRAVEAEAIFGLKKWKQPKGAEAEAIFGLKKWKRPRGAEMEAVFGLWKSKRLLADEAESKCRRGERVKACLSRAVGDPWRG
jgi:hypothetical protein